MTSIPDLGPAARQVAALLDGMSDDHLSACTPCEEYTVGDLLDHFMGLTREFTNAATKSNEPSASGAEAPAEGPPQPSAANLPPDWRSRLPLRLGELAAAWQHPAAWGGTTRAGGVAMPAEVLGIVALDELVIHGWDLARATGQPFESDPESTQAIVGLLSQSADAEGGQGMFGPVVTVPAGASLLDRAIGLSGRDPSWTAQLP